MYKVSNLEITNKQTLLLFQHREYRQNNIKTSINECNNEVTYYLNVI